MHFIVHGAGAIGCYVGGRLAAGGRQVTLVGRRTFVEQVRARGLQLTDEQGAHTIRNLRATATMLEAYDRSPSAFDLAIFTVKGYDTAAAVAELQQALAETGAPPPALLSVQNGVGNEEMLAQLAAPVIAGHLARLVGAHPSITPAQARTVLTALAANPE